MEIHAIIDKQHRDSDGSGHSDVALNSADRHTQGTDTALGEMAEDIDMDNNSLVTVNEIDGGYDISAINAYSPVSLYTFNAVLTGVGSDSPPTLTKTAGTTLFDEDGVSRYGNFNSVTYFTASSTYKPATGTEARTTLLLMKRSDTAGQQLLTCYGDRTVSQDYSFATQGPSQAGMFMIVLIDGVNFAKSDTDSRLADGDWHLLAVVHDPVGTDGELEDLKFYIDGDSIANVTTNATVIDTDTPSGRDYRIGASCTGTNPWSGGMAMIAEFDTALSQANIQDIVDNLNFQPGRIIGGTSGHSINWLDAHSDLVTSKSITADARITTDAGFTMTGGAGSDDGISTTWVNAEGDTVTVKGGIITAITPP